MPSLRQAWCAASRSGRRSAVLLMITRRFVGIGCVRSVVPGRRRRASEQKLGAGVSVQEPAQLVGHLVLDFRGQRKPMRVAVGGIPTRADDLQAAVRVLVALVVLSKRQPVA